MLKVILRWVGEGAKTTISNAPDADIFRRIIEVLREIIQAGVAIFFHNKNKSAQRRTNE